MISAQLMEFAAPLLEDLPNDTPIEEAERRLGFAQIAWNLALPMVPEKMRREHNTADPLLQELINRKLTLFEQDERFIYDFRVYRTLDGKLQVMALGLMTK